jgi:very-short-patch-repair endonuclease
MKRILSDYLKTVAQTTVRGDAREETYYSALKALLEAFATETGHAAQVTVLPKSTKAGNPDFRIWDGAHHITGYIEAKAPGANLERIETSEQLTRYRQTFPNLILTDFYEFRLYRNGEMIDSALLGRPFIAQKIKVAPPLEQVEKVTHLLETFFSFSLPPAFSAPDLAVELAKRTRFLRDQVVQEELAQGEGDIFGFYQAFQKYLIAGLTEQQFSDLYAQTITYGLFAARTRTQGKFNRKMAFDRIPPTIGILRDVFRFISLGELSPQMEVTIDDIAAVLNAADVNRILQEGYHQAKGGDPIIHFYEPFLAQYDPETRERRGVYYTPEPVVHYIVRSVHRLLQDKFDLPDGLADEHVTLLDPAGGTLTFPAEAIKLAIQEFTAKYGAGGKANFVREHILPHFYAFELMMAPYAIGHMKIGFLLEALGVPLREGDRFQLYLTNTLEMEDLAQIEIPGLSSLSEESHRAALVKKDKPILVILGNPPYSGISANQNEWTERLLKKDPDGAQSYYTVDGRPLGERNPKWLQDDYVKFLRFAQWKIHKAGRGIVAMITNHGYLDNPTFRGMRQSLTRTFDDIYVLDLHGSSLKRETAPDGGLDENVFDIRQGVATALLVKYDTSRPRDTGGDGSLAGWRTPPHLWEKLKPLAREMRQSPTPAEDALWQRLRRKQLGVKFRCQHAIGRFIVDFYCAEASLVVEVDGPIHQYAPEQDAIRQEFLESQDLRVLRFTNDEVLNEIEGVLEQIRTVLPRPHTPSPSAGREMEGGVYHADLYGRRETKYNWLGAHDVYTTPWQPIQPQTPFYFFIPRDTENIRYYLKWPQITKIFPLNGVGMTTARDKFVIDFDDNNLLNRIRAFKHSDFDDEGLHRAFNIRVKKGWSIRKAWKQLQSIADEDLRSFIQPVLYRPFDERYIFYHDAVVWRTVKRVMHHMLAGENVALLWTRPMSPRYEFSCFCTSRIIDQCVAGNKTAGAGISYCGPLYLYNDTEQPDMFVTQKRPNVDPDLLEALGTAYGTPPAPEDLLTYIYAVFYSSEYRQTYAEFLRVDFPRVPFPAKAEVFQRMTALGQRLIALHLLKSPELHPPAIRYQGSGEDDVIAKARYDAEKRCVYINQSKYFEGITPEMWDDQIGGYKVLQKYLKDRKGRCMDDPRRYIHIATAIQRTMDIQIEIDAVYPDVEANVLAGVAT